MTQVGVLASGRRWVSVCYCAPQDFVEARGWWAKGRKRGDPNNYLVTIDAGRAIS